LPIIDSGLIAKPGEILIIENPEAHLHPYAQSIIAKFLSLVSKTGVQVFIESHSDHILNGLRIEVYDQVIKNEDLNVLYFDNDLDSIYTKIEIDSEGGVLNWPEKFFDQATKDLNYLYGM
jgi:predicted ATPase